MNIAPWLVITLTVDVRACGPIDVSDFEHLSWRGAKASRALLMKGGPECFKCQCYDVPQELRGLCLEVTAEMKR